MANNQPDVRIRLSAEGVQEVVNALKQVQAQAGKSQAAAGNVGAGMSKAAEGVEALKASVAKLSGAFAMIGGMAYLKGLNDQSAAMGRLSQSTGVSVEQLSKLSYAMKKNGVEAGDAEGALYALAEKIYDAYNGAGESADIFRAMGISVKDSAGKMKDLRTVLMEMADKFATYNDGVGKSAIAQKLMGDAGAKLIPTLNSGAVGLLRMEAAADKAGATLNDKSTQEALKFNEQLMDLESNLASLARTLTGPVIEAINTFSERFNKAREAGQGFNLSAWSALTGKKFDSKGKDVGSIDAPSPELPAAKADGKPSNPKPLPDPSTLQRPNLNIPPPPNLGSLPSPPPAPTAANGKTDAPVIGQADNEQKLRKARLDKDAADANSRLAWLKSFNAKMLEQDSLYYEQSLTSLDSYYGDKEAQIKAENAAELDAAKKALEAAKATLAITPLDQAAKDQAVAMAQADIKQKQQDGELRLKQLEHERYSALKSLQDERFSADQKQLELTGKLRDAEVAALNDEVQKYGELLTKLGLSNDKIEEQKKAMLDRGMARANFNEYNRQYQDQGTAADSQRADIDRKVSTGKMWGFEADAKKLQNDKDRLNVMEDLVAKMEQEAKASGSKEMVQQVEQYKDAIKDLRVATDEYGQAIGKLQSTMEQSLTNGFSTMLDSIVEGTATAKDAVRAFAYDVVNSIRKVAQELLVNQIFKQLFASYGGGGGLAGLVSSFMGGGAGFSTGGAVKAATGGFISGPGTGTSDSIPAWLSNGEYVMKASTVKALGTDVLDAINKGGSLPQVNTLGLSSVKQVTDGGLSGSVADSTGGNSHITIGLDQGLILKALQTPEGKRTMVKVMHESRRAINQAR